MGFWPQGHNSIKDISTPTRSHLLILPNSSSTEHANIWAYGVISFKPPQRGCSWTYSSAVSASQRPGLLACTTIFSSLTLHSFFKCAIFILTYVHIYLFIHTIHNIHITHTHVYVFRDKVSFLCNSADCPVTYYVNQGGFELTEIRSPLPPKWWD